MKKTLICSLALILLLPCLLSACGNNDSDSQNSIESLESSEGIGAEEKAFNISKEAYNGLQTAYDIVRQYGSDIYQAWYEGIYHSKDLSISYLASKTSLDKDELYDGLAYYLLGSEWETAPDSKKHEYRTDTYFEIAYYMTNQKISLCLTLVCDAYITNGLENRVEELLSDSKTLLRSLSNDYSDYKNYPKLKELYTKINSYFAFCKSPTGSFEQLVDTKKEYENDIRDLFDDLDFVFGE